MQKAAGIVFLYNNKILLAHPTNAKYWNTYSIPKGGVDQGESIINAAVREAYEEVGISVKPSQLSKSVYTIHYKSKGMYTDVPKGQIYKTLYYYIVHVDNLNEIGLNSEVVPKNQLQIAEVNWAGFIDYNEAKKRIAPVMLDCLQHIKNNENMTFKLKNFNEGFNQNRNSGVKKYVKTFEEFIEEDEIQGGLADKMGVEDIAKKHGVEVTDIEAQIEKGIKIEMEHVDDEAKAKEIAMDHLVEDPKYYDKLETIE